MVTGGLLHHHLHPRSPHHLAESHYVLCRRSALNRLRLPRKRYASTPGLIQPLLKSVQCLHQEEQAGNNGEAVEWVNKAPHDPMVEFDPVTVFRRIVVERRISSARAKAKEEADLALQTTSPPPFITGSKWRGKSGIAIFTALLILVVVAVLFFLRSKKGGREDVKELPSADGNDTLKASGNGRRKIVEDVIKAPDSVLTAMALGAASVSRPKVHSSSTHDTLPAPNGNAVESQTPEGVMDFFPVVSTVAVEDMKPDLHGKAILFGQTSSSASVVEDFTPLKIGNVGIEVTEGPWFGQDVNDTASAELQDIASVMSPPLVGSQELETEKLDRLLESQALPFVSETIAVPTAEQFDSEISIGEAGLETSGLTNIVDGDFHGDVVAVSEQPNHSNVQVLDFKPEESQKDPVFAESSTTSEKVEGTNEEDSTPLKGGCVAEDTFYPEPNIVIESPALDLSNGQFDETDSGSVDDDNENTEHHGVEQSLTLNQDDGVMSLEASDSKNAFEDVQEGYSLSPSLDSISTEGQENVSSLLFNADHVLEAIESVPDDALDGVSSSANMSAMDQVEEEQEFVYDPIKEPLLDYHAVEEVSEEDSREDSKKALDAAVPAIAIGFGTVGALFGVAGGLQVVGFAALASILSHDFLWAQSRESLWQELNGITDRQKLLEFLAKRNIMGREQENLSL